MTGARILVVEDNSDNLRLFEVLLRAFGHEPILTTNAPAGIVAASSLSPDLILMDLQMPGMDGFDAAAAIRADASVSRVPIVALTAYAMVGDREAALAAGFDGYIRKPIEPASFASLIDPFLPDGKRSTASVLEVA